MSDTSRGVRIRFKHQKIFLVDQQWYLIWDSLDTINPKGMNKERPIFRRQIAKIDVMFYLNSTLNFGIPPVLVYQLEVYYKVDRLLTGLPAQKKEQLFDCIQIKHL